MGNEQTKDRDLNMNGTVLVNGVSANITPNGMKIDANGKTVVQQNGGPKSFDLSTESTDYVVVESDSPHADAPIISETLETVTQTEKVNDSGKTFKKTEEPPADVKIVQGQETSNEDQTSVSPPATDPHPETANLKRERESLTEPESVTVDAGPEDEKAPETDNGNSQSVENQEDSDIPIMNFFKTLVSSTKTKKDTATPDATKDKSQKESQPAAATTVAQVSEPPAAPKAMSVPPPPPPEPPKMEIKGEPAAKPVKPSPKEEPKAAKEPESSKGISARDSLGRFFRKKKVDPSKAGTLEASPKPEPPPPVQEEKKTASKSAFMSLFKPKAADPKKATTAPAAAAEAAQTAKAKEEPKAAAKSSEAAVENKPASAASKAGDDAAEVPKKQEKRNSITLLFKILGQKRNSTDAGVQTEPVTVAPAAEKAK